MQSLDRGFRSFFLFYPSVRFLYQSGTGFESLNVVPTPFSLSNVIVPPIFSNQFFCDWHPQPCFPANLVPTSCMLLAQMVQKCSFLKCPFHPDPCILANKFGPRHARLFQRVSPCSWVYRCIRFPYYTSPHLTSRYSLESVSHVPGLPIKLQCVTS